MRNKDCYIQILIIIICCFINPLLGCCFWLCRPEPSIDMVYKDIEMQAAAETHNVV